jgi:hypothetical protein
VIGCRRFIDVRNYADALLENIGNILTVHAVCRHHHRRKKEKKKEREKFSFFLVLGA